MAPYKKSWILPFKTLKVSAINNQSIKKAASKFKSIFLQQNVFEIDKI
jgi:hypothetical protein